MKIWPDLLEKDPYREIISVVKVNEHSPKIVWTELEEYVPTDEVKNYFRKFIEEFIESRRGPTENVCVWISGFFGSGKSHFLKVLGYLLENRKILTPDGLEIESTQYLANKLGLQNLAPLLTKEFRTKVLFINLLDYDHATDPPISRLIYRKLMEEKGLSSKIWVSMWEEEFQKRGFYDEFKQWDKKEFEDDWEEARKLHAERILKKALTVFMKTLYPEERDAEKAINESKKVEIEPSFVVRKLKEFAEEIDENKGRIVILLDEVGLYIGDDKNRLTDLNALAEQVVKEGEGKVWLIATAQEALPEMVERLTAEKHILEWLRDRFRLQLLLTPKGVERVVSERMLKKRVEAIEKLKEFYQKNTGKILQVLTLKQTRQNIEINGENFVRFYPFYPYSISLLQEISRALVRSIEDARRLSARERSILKIVHAILRGEGGIDAVAEKQLGFFVTFDLLYDAISQDLRFIKSDYHNIIDNEIGKIGTVDGIKASSVAKALFLLQNIDEKVPTTLENLSAVLFSDISCDINTHKEAIKNCLEKLEESGWVVEEDGKYRLLTYEEHNIEGIIRENLPRPGEKQRFVREILKEKLEAKFTYGKSNRPFEVKITIDGEDVTKEGNLRVALYTPLSGKDESEVEIESINNSDTVFWLAGVDSEFDRLLERTIALEKTINQLRSSVVTETQRIYLKSLQEEYETNKNDKIPRLLEAVFRKGIIYVNGVKYKPTDGDIRKTIETRLKPIADNLYSEFVDVRLKDEDCAKILNWQPGTKVPDEYVDLGIIVNNSLNVSSKIPSLVLKKIEHRRNYGLSRTGKDLISDFEKPPYGWDPKIVRLAVATLFKAGKISVLWNNREYTTASPELFRLFSKISEFNKASFDLLPEVDWRKASELISTIFGEVGGDTFEKTAEKVDEVARYWSGIAKTLKVRVSDNELPKSIQSSISEFLKDIDEIVRAEDPNTKLRRFIEREESLKRNFKTVKKLQQFDFDSFRKVKKFAENLAALLELLEFSDELKRHFDSLMKIISSEEIVDRFDDVLTNYSILLEEVEKRYERAHSVFAEGVRMAIEEIKKHNAFKIEPNEAKKRLEKLHGFICDQLDFDETSLRCRNCGRLFTALNEAIIEKTKKDVIKDLDLLLPKKEEEEEKYKPYRKKKIVRINEVDEVIDELKEHFKNYPGEIELEINANPKGG